MVDLATYRPGFTATQLAARAAYLLRGNDLGAMTSAAPKLYPHMWSWDAAFVSVGLATLSVERAIMELDTLLSAQWSDGMIPHIVFANGVDGYFPGPARWECRELAEASPEHVDTSGIIQPAVHAIAVQRILDHAVRRGGHTRRAAQEFFDRRWPNLLLWHRWLAKYRDPTGSGLITIHHGWESGMDNSPRWDRAYANVIPGDLPEYERKDTGIVSDTSQRPSNLEYDRYLWLVEEMKSVRYDPVAMAEKMSFAVQDVFSSAIVAVSSDILAVLGEEHGKPRAEVREMQEYAERFRAGVASTADPETGAGRDRDVHTGEWSTVETIASFAPLLCGGLPSVEEQKLLELLDGPRFCGHPQLRFPVPPSTSPCSEDFKPREYWRGPVWPVTTWLLSWTFARRGWVGRAEFLRHEGLRQAADGTFAEYYEPFTGEALGSMQQSWTAAAVLDWLG